MQTYGVLRKSANTEYFSRPDLGVSLFFFFFRMIRGKPKYTFEAYSKKCPQPLRNTTNIFLKIEIPTLNIRFYFQILLFFISTIDLYILFGFYRLKILIFFF